MSKEHILDTAYKMAQRDGFAAITRDGVAAEAGVAMGSVNHHYGTMQVLRDAVMQRAVEEQQLELIAQGIALGDNVAKSAPLELRQRALTTLL
ncbi:TetR family transcriptional regulator [Phage vB_KsaM-C1]|nr:TetR family transcriptional regulator [Phage vB_KsaM-C1]